MITFNTFRLAVGIFSGLSLSAGAAGVPLREATITRTINEVRVVRNHAASTAARVSEIIKEDMGVKTGVKSRAELRFQDDTLTRLGAETYFTFQPGTREMSLEKGTLLLQVPKNHGGAVIRAASVTAAITGTTVMIEHIPGKSLKLLVLEGSMRVSQGRGIGQTLSLRAGKMLLIEPGAKKLPAPLAIDLQHFTKTSSLVSPALFAPAAKNQPDPLPSIALIDAAIAKQDQQRRDGTLVDTNLVIVGKGTTLRSVNASSSATGERINGRALTQDSDSAARSDAANARLSLTAVSTTPSLASSSIRATNIADVIKIANTPMSSRSSTAGGSSSNHDRSLNAQRGSSSGSHEGDPDRRDRNDKRD